LENVQELANVYYDPVQPEGYAGGVRLKKRFPQHDVKQWLGKQTTYTLHKPMRRSFPTRKYKTSGPNELWQMDLMEMIPYARINKGYKYILTCIDVFSRFARAEPLKSKDSKSVATALISMFKSSNDIPRYIQTDLGKEFYNKEVQKVFKDRKIKHYSVHSLYKAALVERFNRTLRERLNRFFTHQGSKVWYKTLSQIIDAYNSSSHRGINGLRPKDIVNDIDQWLFQQTTINSNKHRKPYELGSLVRISRLSI
jgi:transposase InsO family protein